MRLAATCFAAGLLCSAPALAQFESTPMAVVRPGGGILTADGISKVPLQIVLVGADDGPGIRRARIVASEGEISETKVVGAHRVQFIYAPPQRKSGFDEIFDVALTMRDGNTVAEAFTLAVPAFTAPTVELNTDPPDLLAEAPMPVQAQATAYGEGLEGLLLRADGGKLTGPAVTGDASALVLKQTLEIPPLPPDAPSHFVLLAIAASNTGFAATLNDVPVMAPIRLSVEIPRGTWLEVSGAKNNPPKVRAPADGRTVMEGVEVDLSSAVKIFERKGRKRRQLSVVVPTGVVSNGVALPIPGQDLADGGAGPTIIVAIPPAAFGAPLFWPDIEVEGADLLKTEPLGKRMKVLILQRPKEPKTVRVLLDEQDVGTIAFSPARGQKIKLQALAPKNGERAAISVVVTDAEGAPTDFPVPQVRLASGDTLPFKSVATGRYRAQVPPGTAGAPGSEIEVIAQLAPLPKVAGASLEYAQDNLKVALKGPPPAIKTNAPAKVVAPRTRTRRSEQTLIGVGIQGLFGTSLSSLLMFGGGLNVDVRLPVVNHRLALRGGVEFVRGRSSAGRIAFDDDRRLETSTALGGFIFPIEVGFAIVKTDNIEMLAYGGATIRAEQAALQVQEDSPGGASRVGLAGRVGLETALSLGSSQIYLGGVVDGIGADLSAFSTDQVTLSGSLMNFRGDVGFRFWF